MSVGRVLEEKAYLVLSKLRQSSLLQHLQRFREEQKEQEEIENEVGSNEAAPQKGVVGGEQQLLSKGEAAAVSGQEGIEDGGEGITGEHRGITGEQRGIKGEQQGIAGGELAQGVEGTQQVRKEQQESEPQRQTKAHHQQEKYTVQEDEEQVEVDDQSPMQRELHIKEKQKQQQQQQQQQRAKAATPTTDSPPRVKKQKQKQMRGVVAGKSDEMELQEVLGNLAIVKQLFVEAGKAYRKDDVLLHMTPVPTDNRGIIRLLLLLLRNNVAKTKRANAKSWYASA